MTLKEIASDGLAARSATVRILTSAKHPIKVLTNDSLLADCWWLMSRRIGRPHWGLPFYYYLARAYSRFLVAGRCLDAPRSLQIQTKSFCNSRCIICPYPVVSKTLPQGTMQRDLFEKIVSDAATEPLLTSVLLELHNEPLLDGRTFEFVRFVKTSCPDKRVSVVTNGELLHRFSLDEIKESGLDSLHISLNAHSQEVFEVVNRGIDYHRVMNNLSMLRVDPVLRKKLVLNFVVTRQNEPEMEAALRFWKKLGVKTQVLGLINRSGTLENYESTKSRSEAAGQSILSRASSRVLDGAQWVTGCPMPFHQMCVLYNGDVILCCNDWNRATVVGNLETGSIHETWNSAAVNTVRRLVLAKKYDQIDSCRQCSVPRPTRVG